MSTMTDELAETFESIESATKRTAEVILGLRAENDRLRKQAEHYDIEAARLADHLFRGNHVALDNGFVLVKREIHDAGRKALEVVEAAKTEVRRLSTLLAGARETCERRTRERDEALAELKRYRGLAAAHKAQDALTSITAEAAEALADALRERDDARRLLCEKSATLDTSIQAHRDKLRASADVRGWAYLYADIEGEALAEENIEMEAEMPIVDALTGARVLLMHVDDGPFVPSDVGLGLARVLGSGDDEEGEPIAKGYRDKPLTADDLVRRAVNSAGHGEDCQYPRWSWVGRIFGLGSTSSTELCRRYGFDPDELQGNLDEKDEDE